MIVQNILMDMEFNNTIDEPIENVVVNTPAANEDVAEIEKTIRTVKERTRCIVTTIPFK